MDERSLGRRVGADGASLWAGYVTGWTARNHGGRPLRRRHRSPLRSLYHEVACFRINGWHQSRGRLERLVGHVFMACV